MRKVFEWYVCDNVMYMSLTELKHIYKVGLKHKISFQKENTRIPNLIHGEIKNSTRKKWWNRTTETLLKSVALTGVVSDLHTPSKWPGVLTPLWIHQVYLTPLSTTQIFMDIMVKIQSTPLGTIKQRSTWTAYIMSAALQWSTSWLQQRQHHSPSWTRFGKASAEHLSTYIGLTCPT